MRVSEGSARTKELNVLLSRVRASLSQKLMVPSEPVVRGQSSGMDAYSCQRRTASGKCAMHGVECDIIHGVHKRLVLGGCALIFPVAFEREVVVPKVTQYNVVVA